MNMTEKRKAVADFVKKVTRSNKEYKKYSKAQLQQEEVFEKLSPKAKEVQQYLSEGEPFGCHNSKVAKLISKVMGENIIISNPDEYVGYDFGKLDYWPKLYSAIVIPCHGAGSIVTNFTVYWQDGELHDEEGEECLSMLRYATDEEIDAACKKLTNKTIEECFDFLID